jgi:SAM-dependent methyltransferase
VTGLDLVPELLEAGRERAAEAGVEIEWVEGDAESLPVDDGSFDVVISTVGSMFAPDHAAAAREIGRVTKPGGRVAIASWKPDGNIGRFFATVAKHTPPPPPDFQPPLLWGSEDHVREIFEGTGLELEFEDGAVNYRFRSLAEEVELFETKFGPVVMAKAALEPEGKWEALREELAGLFSELDEAEGEEIAYPGQYLLAYGKKV